MLFEEMLPFLKEGKKAINLDWNGKGMCIFVSKIWNYSIENPIITPFIVMETANKSFFPWLPSQLDMFSENWKILDDVEDLF
jgi:hypothetical protein